MIVAFIILQIMNGMGMLSFSLQGMLVPICAYVDAHGAPDDHRAVLRQIGEVFQQADVEAVLIHAHIEVGKNGLDDLTEGQGHTCGVLPITGCWCTPLC